MPIRTNIHSNKMTGPTSADNEATLGTIILHNFLISGWMKQFFFWLGDTKIGTRVLQFFLESFALINNKLECWQLATSTYCTV
jgi:hypothetical protein